MLFHYSQLDFRKCVKTPKTVPKWDDQLNFEFERDLRELEVELVLRVANSSSNSNQKVQLLRDARRALELQAKDPKVAR